MGQIPYGAMRGILLSERYVLVFLHIPKTGGSTFQSLLQDNLGPSHCHTNHTRRPVFTERDFRLCRRFFPRLQSLAGHNLIAPDRLPVEAAFFMTILRDPIVRVASHYQNMVRLGRSTLGFEQAVRSSEQLENLQVKLIAGGRDLDKAKKFLSQTCQFVGLTEEFNLSVHVFGRLFPDRFKLSYRSSRVARNNDVKKSVLNDNRLVGLAKERNRLDLELYAFARNEVFPALCEKAGVTLSDPVPNYQSSSRLGSARRRLGRLYNKMFRQYYKLHSTFWPDPTSTEEFAWFQPTHIARE